MALRRKSSKRVSCAQRYKIEKRVREHQRKCRRDAKRDPTLRKKTRKDPGIPALWPFRDRELAAAQQAQDSAANIASAGVKRKLDMQHFVQAAG